MIAIEPTKKFQSNLANIFPTVKPWTDWVLKVTHSKVNVTEDIFKWDLKK